MLATLILYSRVSKTLRQPNAANSTGSFENRKRKLASSFGTISKTFLQCYVPYAVMLCANEIMGVLQMEKGIG